jgi:hypothetical protein
MDSFALVVLLEQPIDSSELARIVKAHFEGERLREITFALLGRGEPLP